MKSKHSNLVDKVFEEAKNKNKSVEYFDCLKPNGNISMLNSLQLNLLLSY